MKVKDILVEYSGFSYNKKQLLKKAEENFARLGFELEYITELSESYTQRKFIKVNDLDWNGIVWYFRIDNATMKIITQDFDKWRKQYPSQNHTMQKFIDENYPAPQLFTEYYGLEPNYGFINDIDLERVQDEVEAGNFGSGEDYVYIEAEYSSNSEQTIFSNEAHRWQHILKQPVITNIEITKSKDWTKWYLDKDSSILPDRGGSDDEEQQYGFELTSPIFYFDDGLKNIQKIFSILNNDKRYETNNTTGFHINISIDQDMIQNIDKLKLSLLLGEKQILKTFDRENNTYTKPLDSKLKHIFDRVFDQAGYDSDVNLKDYRQLVKLINKMIPQDKYMVANFSKLDKGYIEFRAVGGADYHKKYELIERTIFKYLQAIIAACDPNAYKQQYFKILFKLFGKHEHKIAGKTASDRYQKFKFLRTGLDILANYDLNFKKISDIYNEKIGAKPDEVSLNRFLLFVGLVYKTYMNSEISSKQNREVATTLGYLTSEITDILADFGREADFGKAIFKLEDEKYLKAPISDVMKFLNQF